MIDNVVEIQTQRLIDYAKEKVRLIGDAIQLYNSQHHFDRTGNLLNSICWGVAYSGKLKDYGFYRDANVKSYNTSKNYSTNQSFLHEFFYDVREAYEVDGRRLAESFIKSRGRASAPGWWRIWFAILAPYWGYWEEGFRMKSNFGNREKFLRFQVMSEFHDKVKEELSPAKVTMDVFVPEYSHDSLKWDFEKYQKNVKYQYNYLK